MTPPEITPPDPLVTLECATVRMEPLSRSHFDALIEVGLAEELWLWTNVSGTTPDLMREYLEAALRDRDAGQAIPYATIDLKTGRAVGSSRFGAIDMTNRHVEIGWTWIAPQWQRTHVNSGAKYLMLRHAFEVWNCLRVELKTDALNTKSRNAMLRLGAKEEGTFRRHIVTYTGRIRDSVYFSIVAEEWPSVKSRLEPHCIDSIQRS